MKLSNMKNSLAICKPLVDFLVAAITTRFYHYLNDWDCQLAAAFYPKFLHRFYSNLTISVKGTMDEKVKRAVRDQNGDSTTCSSGSSMQSLPHMPEDLFDRWMAAGSNTSVKQKAKKLVDTWLDADGKESMANSD